jgi:hypothetical protein
MSAFDPKRTLGTKNYRVKRSWTRGRIVGPIGKWRVGYRSAVQLGLALGSTILHLQSILGGANHSTNSFVFSTEATLCEGRFCSASSGTRVIGSCMIGRARLVWRRTCRRDSSSSSGGPKTRRTIIANTNHPLIVSLYRVVQKSPHDRAGIGSSQRIGCVIRRIRVPDGSSYSTRSKHLWSLVKYCRSQLVPKCD